jgi:hypothetical protein
VFVGTQSAVAEFGLLSGATSAHLARHPRRN